MHAVYTISRLIHMVKALLVEYNVIAVTELHAVWDFSTWLEPFVHNIKGFATSQYGDGMHEFLIRKDRHGVVRIVFRKSSQASTWQPEGQGLEVFKTEPTGRPCFADFKPDSAWERQTVEATVRYWLPHFAIPRDEDRTAAHAEWTSRLWELPPNLKPDNLPASQLPKWPTLPTAGPRQ
eukprot:3331825-Pleurochrysis_carterae.AAC.1